MICQGKRFADFTPTTVRDPERNDSFKYIQAVILNVKIAKSKAVLRYNKKQKVAKQRYNRLVTLGDLSATDGLTFFIFTRNTDDSKNLFH